MRNLLILEDKQKHLEALKKIISEVSSDVCIFTASNVLEAATIAVENTIHLFLVDIILTPNNPGDTLGIRFAENIRNVSKYEFTPLVFITSLEDPELNAYKRLNCLAYIEKPFDKQRVQEVIKKALRFPLQEEEDKVVYFRKEGILYAKSIMEIIWIENHRRMIKIYCTNDVLEIPYKTCDELMRELDSNMFIQCSRNSIVNRKYIKQIDYVNRYIKMKYVEEPVEIGIVMKKRFREMMESFLID